MRITWQRVVDYVVDTIILNMIGLVVMEPYYYFVCHFPTKELWDVFWSFWTIGWPLSFILAIVLREFRKRIPYLDKSSTGDETE